MDTDALDRIERTLGQRPERLTPLHGGCIAEVVRADLPGGDRVAIKLDRGERPRLDVEGRMLGRLARTPLPVPGVLASAPDVLVLEFIEADGRRSAEGERAAGERLAALHGMTADAFGLDEDGLIGPIDQPNAWLADWGAFYAERRLRPLSEACAERGSISRSSVRLLERLCDLLPGLLGSRGIRPGLIHGDVWGGNVLWHRGHVAAYIDPAPYHADPEVELAFIDLFSCFGAALSEAYRSVRPAPAEAGWLRDLYQLYPLLVHARLFAGGYGASVEATLGRVTDGI